jgi:hypothetical protein
MPPPSIYATLHGELGTILNWVERRVAWRRTTKKPLAWAKGLV